MATAIGGLAFIGALSAAPASHAATASYVGGIMTFTGTDTDSTIDMKRSGADLRVDVSGDNIVGAPPGGCSGSATHVSCPAAGIFLVVVSGAGGKDAISVAGTEPAIITTVSGGEGDDTMTGTPGITGTFSLLGEGGADKLTITPGVTADGLVSLSGGAGNDTLTGGSGAESLNGGTGVPAGEDTDSLYGGEGDDSLELGPGADSLNGGGGRDRVFTNLPKDPADPSDVILPNFSGALQHDVAISLDGVPNDGVGSQGADVRTDVEDVTTSDGNDTVVGSGVRNVILTGAGNDTITGGGGIDEVASDDRNTPFTGSNPQNRPFGGVDTIDVLDGGGDVVRCGAFDDTVTADTLDDLERCEAVTAIAPPGPPPVVPPAVVVDTTKPVVRAGTAADAKWKGLSRASLAAGKTVEYPVNTAETATFDAELTAAPLSARIAKVGDLTIATSRLGSGSGTRRIKLRVGKKYRRAMAKVKRLRIVLTATDAAGNVTKTTQPVRLVGKVPARKKRRT